MMSCLKRTLALAVALTSITAICASAIADERVLPREIFQQMGFRPVLRASRPVRSFPARGFEASLSTGLPWPVQFKDEAHTIAQNYVNFQDYGGGAYFHKGCDLRTQPHSWVIAPVSGVLEGGYYGYETHEDGSQTKFWNPWKGDAHPDPYFELAIVTDEGYRFELHHVDVMDLPQETIAALNKGGVRVPAGARIGHVLEWNFGDYDHIHYNVFAADGTIINPEAHSVAVRDTVAPAIQGVYALYGNGRVSDVREGLVLDQGVREIVVATTESRNNDAYVQTPPFAGIAFQNGPSFAWDFRESLTAPGGGFPDLRKVFASRLRTPSGQLLRTIGNYGKGLFLMRLPVAQGVSGQFVVRVADTAGNFSQVAAQIR